MIDWKFDDFAKIKLRCVNFNGMFMVREKIEFKKNWRENIGR